MTIEQFNEKYPNQSVNEMITIINQLAEEQGKTSKLFVGKLGLLKMKAKKNQ